MHFIGRSQKYFIFAILQSLTISVASASGFASCTSSSFLRSVGYILRGFLLGEVEVGDIMECKKRCIISANCLSLNILTNADGRSACVPVERRAKGKRRPRAVCTAWSRGVLWFEGTGRIIKFLKKTVIFIPVGSITFQLFSLNIKLGWFIILIQNYYMIG